ncbi:MULTISPECIES: SWIM zinc finger family protein [unclassified Moraxella]|uniref:SWIM zinc finger family protein n=1 Tax=unclassified Moraxella TaxID=2685852 RepID=UPI003AF564B7
MTPIRHDILNLNEEKLVQLANVGLVKRANKALDNGDIPNITLTADSLISEFNDGHKVTWQTDNSITDSQCTCPAPMCRHRVQTVLAYRQAHDNPNVTVSSPHEISREQIEKLANATVLKKAQRLCQHGLTMKLTPMQDNQCASAVLPMATVKFWGGANLTEASCDCLQKQDCEHILLASIAYQQLDTAPSRSIDRVMDKQQLEQFFAKSPQALSPQATSSNPANEPTTSHEMPISFSLKTDSLTNAEIELWSALLTDGATVGRLRYQRLIQDISDSLAKSKEIWLQAILNDLQKWLTAYENRRSDFEADKGFELLSEYVLRSLARQNPTLHNTVLGVGLAHETPIITARLVSLGCRITVNHAVNDTVGDNGMGGNIMGDNRQATVMLFDSKTQTLLPYRHAFGMADTLDNSQRLSQLQRLRISSSISLQQLATGQLTCQRAKRLANHELILATSRKTYNQVLPQQGDWATIASVCQTHLSHQRQLPMFLQGRYQQPNFIVLNFTRIIEHGYDPANQQYVAIVEDESGTQWLIYRQFQPHTPFALHSMATAFLQAQGSCIVSGTYHIEQGIYQLEAWAVVTDRLYVLDIDDSIHHQPLALQNAPTLYIPNLRQHHNVIDKTLFDFTQQCVKRLVNGESHQTLSQFMSSLTSWAEKFGALGLADLADAINGLVKNDLPKNDLVKEELFKEGNSQNALPHLLMILAKIRLYL